MQMITLTIDDERLFHRLQRSARRDGITLNDAILDGDWRVYPSRGRIARRRRRL